MKVWENTAMEVSLGCFERISSRISSKHSRSATSSALSINHPSISARVMLALSFSCVLECVRGGEWSNITQRSCLRFYAILSQNLVSYRLWRCLVHSMADDGRLLDYSWYLLLAWLRTILAAAISSICLWSEMSNREVENLRKNHNVKAILPHISS